MKRKRKTKAQKLFENVIKANKPYRKESIEQDRKELQRAEGQFCWYLAMLAQMGKLYTTQVNKDTGDTVLRPVDPSKE